MTSAVSDFYADLATENRMEESPILKQNKKIMDQYLKSMEDLETELLALDLLLEKKAESDNKRSDFRKNVTMKAGRGIRKLFGYSEGRRMNLEKKIKNKEEQWKAIAKSFYTNPTKSNPFWRAKRTEV